MQKLRIIKIGGQVVDDTRELERFLSVFSKFEGHNILVHGGGRLASVYSERMKIKPNLISGRRITDKDTLDVVQMVYAGLLNKNIVAYLQKYGCQALGMSGADLDSVKAVKRPVDKIDYGFVGDVVKVNDSAIMNLLERGITPVFCALTHDGQGQILNTNADTIATELGIKLSGFYDIDLVFCFEKKGVLENPDEDADLIPEISANDYKNLKNNGNISEGMIPKIDNAFRAIYQGVKNVCIISAKDLDNYSLSGTKIVA
jgi:acetylglutamate kinase